MLKKERALTEDVGGPYRTLLKQSRQEEMVACTWHENGGDVEKCAPKVQRLN